MAPNKVVAKLASDFKKPDGLVVVRPSEMREFMGPLPVDRLYGVGGKSSRLLHDNGIVTIGDLARTDVTVLDRSFGRKTSAYLHNAANGIDDEPVVERGEATQISRIITLKRDSQSVEEILAQLGPAVEDINRRVMEKGLFFRSVSVIGILPNLSIRMRSRALDSPTDQPAVLDKTVHELLSLLVSEVGELRRVGIKVADFTAAADQSSLTEFLR